MREPRRGDRRPPRGVGEARKLGELKGEVTVASGYACHAKLGLFLQLPVGPFSSKAKLLESIILAR